MAAHPDDEILGVGGTLLRHVDAGDEVQAVCLCECDARTFDEQGEQMNESSRRLGIPVLWALDAEGSVSIFRPDIVYTHSTADLHQDHQDVHHRTLVACRPQSGVKAIYAFETPSATDWSGVPFHPQRFVDIGSTLTRKLAAMQAYQSELRPFPHPRNIESLTIRAQAWGQRAGVDYAEAFQVIRETW